MKNNKSVRHINPENMYMKGVIIQEEKRFIYFILGYL